SEPGYAPQPQLQQPQPYPPRETQPFPPRDQQQQQHNNRPQQHFQQQPNQGGNANAPDVGGLPSFITGGGQPQQYSPNQNSQNGYEQNGGNNNQQHAQPSQPHDGGDEPPRQPGE